MGEIKSALEIAMEKAERLGKASKEELEREEFYAQGRRAAARFLSGEVKDLKGELGSVPPQGLKAAMEGAVDALVRNILLPKDEFQAGTAKKALQGIEALKGSTAKATCMRIGELLQLYGQTRRQYLEQMKAQFQGQLGGVKQAIAQQYGAQAAAGIDVENLPEFQEAWSKFSSELDSQFEAQLAPLKEYLAAL